MKKRIGIQGFLLFFALFMSVIFSKALFPRWQARPLDELFDCMGICAILAGFLFRISARGYKWERSDNGRALITDGPYGLVRHPMYFGTLLIGLGVILVLFAWWTFPLFLAVFLLIYIPQGRKEENLLLGRFGDEYKRYLAGTPKYFPRVSGLFKGGLKGCLFFKLSWVKKELPSLIGVIVGTMALEIWGHKLLFGRALYLRELLEFSFIAAFFVIIALRKS